jgi:hypothetical protein
MIVLKIITAIIILTSIPSFAATKYVSPSGSAAWGDCTVDSSPCSLATANANVAAGDTVKMMSGSYSTDINPCDTCDGTDWTTGLITFDGDYDGTVTITSSIGSHGASGEGHIYLDNNSYLKINDVVLGTGATSGPNAISIHVVDNIWLEDITLNGNYNRPVEINNEGVTGEASYIYINRLTISDNDGDSCGNNRPYDQVTIEGNTHHTLIENSTFGSSRHMVFYYLDDCPNNPPGEDCSSYDRPRFMINRNNTSKNIAEAGWGMAASPEDISTDPYVLIEGNFIQQSARDRNGTLAPGCSDHGKGIRLEGDRNIARYSTDDGTIGYKEAVSNRVYNNTLVNNYQVGFNFRWGSSSVNHSDNRMINNIITLNAHMDNNEQRQVTWFAQSSNGTSPCDIFTNNLINDSATETSRLYIETDGYDYMCTSCSVNQFNTNYNDCSSGDWIEATGNFSSSNVGFANSSANDDVTGYYLQSGGDAIDAGTYLTEANNSGNSSISLSVETGGAYFFQDGWGMTGAPFNINPDEICIGTVSNCVAISAIDYVNDNITLASPMTWSSGADIWLYKKSDGERVLYGSAPDVGAHELLVETATGLGMSGAGIGIQ